MTLPIGTALGQLRIVDVIDFYDRPLLFTARDGTGVMYFAYLTDESDEDDFWYYVSVSAERLGDLLGGKVPIRDAFMEPENGVLFLVSTPRRAGGASRMEQRVPTSLGDDSLPPADDFIVQKRTEKADERLPITVTAARPLIATMSLKDVLGGSPRFEIIASALSAFEVVFEHVVRATGHRGSVSPLVPVDARIQSFTVATALPGTAHYVAAARKFGEIVSNGENELARYGFGELLDVVIAQDITLTFKVTEGGQTYADLKLDREIASRLRRVIANMRPFLLTREVPQADDLLRVYHCVELVEAGGEMDDVDPRQRIYYQSAAHILSFLSASGDVTRTGRQLVGMKEHVRHAFTASLFEMSSCGWAWTRWSDVSSLREVESTSAERFLLECAPDLAPTTRHRRAKTLRSWHEALFDLPLFRDGASRQ